MNDSGLTMETLKMYKVIVAGSINMDVVAFADRHPNIGETVLGNSIEFFPGGKGANQAVAAVRAGAETLLVGKMGTDAFSATLDRFLHDQGVNVQNVGHTERVHTGTAVIVVGSQSDNAIVVVPGANADLSAGDVSLVEVEKGDVLVSQFEIPEPTIRSFFEGGRARGATTMLNPAPAKRCDPDLFNFVDILVLNESELAFFCRKDICVGNREDLCQSLRGLRAFDDQVLIVTLGAEGAIAVVGERLIQIPGRKVEARDTTGAGDCFAGSLAARLAGGATLERSLRFANTAASICVQRKGAGTSMPARREVEELIAEEMEA
jgi:ribokinase